MITRTLASIILFGENFSPALAERDTGIVFSEKHEIGEHGTKGRFKDKPYPFGHAVVHSDPTSASLESVLETIVPNMPALKASGVTAGKLQLTYSYRDQCNLEFEPEFLAKLASTGLQLVITCIQDTDEQ